MLFRSCTYVLLVLVTFSSQFLAHADVRQDYRKKDLQTFTLGGKHSKAFVEVSTLKTKVPTFLTPSDYETWSQKKNRKKVFKKLEAHLKQKGATTSFRLVSEAQLGKEAIKVGKVEKKALEALGWKLPLSISLREKPHRDIPIYDLMIGSDLKKGSKLVQVSDLNFGKFFFPKRDLRGYESQDQCIEQVQAFLAEFNRTRKKIYAENPQKVAEGLYVTRVDLSNNCREPGSYEIAIRGGKTPESNDKLFSGYFHIAQPLYDRIMTKWNGLKPADYGLKRRRVAVLKKDGSEYRYVTYQSGKGHGVPACSIENLSPAISNGSGLVILQKGRIGSPGKAMDYVADTVDYDDLPEETQKKAAWKHPKRNSYLFVKINQAKPIPSFAVRKPGGYELPKRYFENIDGKLVQKEVSGSFLKDARNGQEFWKKAFQHPNRIYVPHRFATYAEMFGSFDAKKGYVVGGFWDAQDPNILPSAFEVDGRYGAEQSIDDYAALRLWAIDLDFVQRLHAFEARIRTAKKTSEPRVEIRLQCQSKEKDLCKGKIHNIIIGNLTLKPGERREILLGLGVEPLEVNYIRNAISPYQVYSFAYDKSGKIVDHNPEIGKIVVTRGLRNGDRAHPNHFTVDIITDDRIHPLSRHVLNLGKAYKDYEKRGRKIRLTQK